MLIYFLFNIDVIILVVLLLLNGLNIILFFLVDVRIIFFSKDMGFWVGCLFCFFLDGLVKLKC